MFEKNFLKYKHKIALKEKNIKIYYFDLLKYSTLFKKILKQNSLTFLICENKIGSIVSYTSLINNKLPVIFVATYAPTGALGSGNTIFKSFNLFSIKLISFYLFF